MTNSIFLVFHGLAATLWVGGMFFAYVILRPSLLLLEPHRRLNVWANIFRRFFPCIWAAVLVLPVTGYWMLFSVFGGFSSSPVYVHLMNVLGSLMIGLFIYLYFRPYPVLKSAVASEDWPAAGVALNRIRHIVLVNLVLGLVLLTIVYAGRYGMF